MTQDAGPRIVRGDEFGADWLEAKLAPVSVFGRRSHAPVFAPGGEERAQAAAAAAARAAAMLAAEDVTHVRHELAATPDPVSIAASAEFGEILDVVDLFELARFCAAAAAIRRPVSPLFTAGTLADCLDCAPAECGALAAILAPGIRSGGAFALDDHFDAALAPARARLAAADSAYQAERARLAARAAGALGLGAIRDGEFIVMREPGRSVPGGLIRVTREAPAFWQCELLLDDAAAAARDALDEAAAEAALLEHAVCERLSAQVAKLADEVRAACEALGKLDLFLARVALAQALSGVTPAIANSAAVTFAGGRYPPLVERLAAHGARYTPISLELHGAGVLTGPNMGGKTAALRTCGFLALCGIYGVPVPAAHARIGLFDQIVWIGSGELDGDSLLSSFGRDIAGARDLLASLQGRTLVLIDEFARTTDPETGRALLIALLAHLSEHGACVLATTHLRDVAPSAGATHFIVAGMRDIPPCVSGEPLDAAIARLAASMDYTIVEGGGAELRRNDAVAIAEALGLPPAVGAAARRFLANGRSSSNA